MFLTGMIIGAAAAYTLAGNGAVAQNVDCIEREQAEQLVETLRNRTSQLRTAVGRLQEADRIVAVANARADAASGQIEAMREALAIAETRNRELAEIGASILDDYQSMSLGKRVASGEPLTGLYRVRLENKLQDFEDEIAEARFFIETELRKQQEQNEPPADGNSVTTDAGEPQADAPPTP